MSAAASFAGAAAGGVVEGDVFGTSLAADGVAPAAPAVVEDEGAGGGVSSFAGAVTVASCR